MYCLTKRLNKLVKIIALIFITISVSKIDAQVISRLMLSQANELAQQNYPLIKQKDLIAQTTNLNIENLSKEYLPQFAISALASYQSDVTTLDVPIPNFKFEPIAKDQYKVMADVNQLVYDGGIIKQQKESQRLNEETEQQKIEVQLFQLRERVNQLFLGVLYLDAQIKQAGLVLQNIQIGIKNAEAQVQNGVALHSSVDILKAELLKNQQHIIELDASKKGMIKMLELFINKPLADSVVFEKPIIQQNISDTIINRPEIKLYSDQNKFFEQQIKLIQTKNNPRLSLFFQGGYGRPTFDFLKNKFDFFYIGGIQMNWPLGGLYTRKNETELAKINKRTVDITKEIFLLNLKTQLTQQQSEIDKLKALISTDKNIIALRSSVNEAAKAQLQNGVITVNDYLKEINDENEASQALITHQIQLLQAQINYQTISGNQ